MVFLISKMVNESSLFLAMDRSITLNEPIPPPILTIRLASVSHIKSESNDKNIIATTKQHITFTLPYTIIGHSMQLNCGLTGSFSFHLVPRGGKPLKQSL